MQLGYIVAEPETMNGTRYRLIPQGTSAAVQDGHLVIGANGTIVAIFKPGEWVSVVRNGEVSWRRGQQSGGPLVIGEAAENESDAPCLSEP